MNNYIATEIAYKNGYNQALKDFAERLTRCILERDNEVIEHIAKELEKK